MGASLSYPCHQLSDKWKGHLSHAHTLAAGSPEAPATVVPRQGIGPVLQRAVAGEGLGQLFCSHDARASSPACYRW